MTKISRSQLSDSPGHQLIYQLLALIESGRPLSSESADAWDNALSNVLIAKNKDEAGERFTQMLGLKYKTGTSLNDAEMTVYMVELLLLQKLTKTFAFELLSEADESYREDTTFRDTYYRFRKRHPVEFFALQCLALSQNELGNCFVDASYITLYLALTRQKPVFRDKIINGLKNLYQIY
jgi:hypothetical protein